MTYFLKVRIIQKKKKKRKKEEKKEGGKKEGRKPFIFLKCEAKWESGL